MGSVSTRAAALTTGVILLLLSGWIWLTTVFAIPLFALWAQLTPLPQIAGMGYTRLMHNFLQLMAYLYSPWQGRIVLPDFPISTSGAAHFADVQHLFIFNLLVFLGLLWPVGRRIVQRIRQKQTYVFQRAAQFGVLAVVMIGLGMLLNFNAIFIGFHKLLFRNQDWLFNPVTDPIINVLPETYFAACFTFALTGFVGTLLWFIWRGRRDARQS